MWRHRYVRCAMFAYVTGYWGRHSVHRRCCIRRQFCRSLDPQTAIKVSTSLKRNYRKPDYSPAHHYILLNYELEWASLCNVKLALLFGKKLHQKLKFEWWKRGEPQRPGTGKIIKTFKICWSFRLLFFSTSVCVVCVYTVFILNNLKWTVLFTIKIIIVAQKRKHINTLKIDAQIALINLMAYYINFGPMWQVPVLM